MGFETNWIKWRVSILQGARAKMAQNDPNLWSAIKSTILGIFSWNFNWVLDHAISLEYDHKDCFYPQGYFKLVPRVREGKQKLVIFSSTVVFLLEVTACLNCCKQTFIWSTSRCSHSFCPNLWGLALMMIFDFFPNFSAKCSKAICDVWWLETFT